MAQNAPYGGSPRVNLMPKSEIDRRERRKLLARWATGLVGVVAVTAAIIAGAFYLNMVSEKNLQAEKDRTGQLLSDLASLSDVSAKLKQEQALASFRQEAMHADLQWGPLMGAVAAVLPAGVTITGFDGTPGVGPLGDDPATAEGATFAMTFVSPGPIDIVTVVRTVRGVPTVLHVEGTQLTRDTPVAEDPSAPEAEPEAVTHTYMLTIVSTEEVYSGRFLPEDESQTVED